MSEFFLGGEHPAGITACAPDMVDMWILTPHIHREEHYTDKQLYTNLKALLVGFGGNAGWIRDNMTRDDWINYRPLFAALQPVPWHVGRIILIGDAAHATTLHLASGAGMAVESGLVLTDELDKAASVAEGLTAYHSNCTGPIKPDGRSGASLV